MKIKVSGLTCEDDAMWASNIGVDYLTFSIVADDPQKVSSKKLKEILKIIPPYINIVIRISNEKELDIAKKLLKEFSFGIECINYLSIKDINSEITTFFKKNIETSNEDLNLNIQGFNYIILDKSSKEPDILENDENNCLDLDKLKTIDSSLFFSYELIRNSELGMSEIKIKKKVKELFSSSNNNEGSNNLMGIELNEVISRTVRKKDPDKLFELVKLFKKV